MNNLSPMQQMIYNGQFGAYSPMQNYGYGRYINQQPMYTNMIPIGNSYQQPVNNGYVFQPIGGYQQQPQYQYYQSQQPNYDYYNPYGDTFQQQPPYQYYSNYGYQQNPYMGYNNYNGYRPFISPLERQRMMSEEMELTKIKLRMVNGYFHEDVSEEELDRMVNPQNKANIPTEEEIRNNEEYRFIQYVSYLSTLPQDYSYAAQLGRTIRTMSANMHKELDNHSLCQFLMDDLWKFEREEWIKNNVDRGQGRNLSAVYNSNDYNELLKMHRSSNPYINELLNTSQYDNNIGDLELGMDIALDKARRRQQILEGKVPSFISSDEVQKRRAEWTNHIINQIYNKGGSQSSV